MDPLDLIREGKIKRFFRATRKLNAPNLVSHITQRAAGKEPLFVEDEDYLFLLGLLKEIAGNYSLRLYAFCLMPNHLHLLLSPQEENLYDAMRDLFSRYAMMFNKKYERKGHLFGGPYRQALCLDDGYLLAASLYIHLNPVRAGLARNPAGYRWSSCRLYYEDNAPESFVDPHFVLGLLAEEGILNKKRYRLLLEQGCPSGIPEVLEKEDAVERFLSHLGSLFPSIFKSVTEKRRIANSSGMDLSSMVELESQMEAVRRGLPPRRPESRAAKKFLLEQLIARGYGRGEIAQLLGITRKTVYNILKSRT
jgi:putative transposase